MALNYPNKKKMVHKEANKANLGMDLEQMINDSNEYYLNNNIAVIHKKPTPIQIVKVDYPMRSKAVITEAYYKTPSTTDYNGIYKGKYIDFDAKETKFKTSFPIANVHPHQIEHIKRVINHQGITFLILNMNGLFYLFKGEDFIFYVENTTRKSIPYSYISEKGIIIKENYRPPLDYLKAVDKAYF